MTDANLGSDVQGKLNRLRIPLKLNSSFTISTGSQVFLSNVSDIIISCRGQDQNSIATARKSSLRHTRMIAK